MADERGPCKRFRHEDSQTLSIQGELQEILEVSEDDEDPFQNESEDYSASQHSSSPESNPSDEEGEIELHLPPHHLPSPAEIPGWSNVEVPSPIFLCSKRPGLLVDVNNSKKPIDYFNLLATDDFFDMLCTRANRHAIDILAHSDAENPRIARWVDVTAAEMRKFFGLLLHMGTIKLNRINDCWKKHYMFNLKCFSIFMSRNRFLLILRCLQFGDIGSEQSRTQCGKIQPLVDFFNSKMTEIYYPGRELSIDESMVFWRGRLKFRPCVKGKIYKFGIKMYQLCESNGAVLKTIVYTGSACVELSGPNHTQKVVLELLKDHLNNGHSLYMDNYYNSVSLTKRLLEH
ncbi:piggyBac transposable element-derived protein 4-like [Euwallacea similis]|uniref:piggyBac transposable element-derived protein 4-like n=1 Tax=Euwallacea similis TaxID=1736056 RepID=UPI0034507391